MGVVIGRDAELAALLACADRLAGAGPSAVTVVAAAGMGKSALAVAFREALRSRDLTVLTARPLEAEARLAFSTLGELLDHLPAADFDTLPPPQRAAIRTALLLDDGESADPRAVAAAVRGVFTAQASSRPVVILVDDAQWLDDASAAALGQALPRVTDVPVLLVAWARPSGRPITDWLPDWPRTEIELAPLPMSALFHVVREHLDISLSRGELRAVVEASGGNPLHALEFARHRAAGPAASFEALLAERFLALPRPTRRVLLAAALSSAPTVGLLVEALDSTVDQVLDDLEPAVADGLIRAGSRVIFQHPLYLEAAVDGAASEERAAMHRALAAVEPGEEARVRHRALADTEPDETLAAALTSAADQAWARAAWSSATELLQLAVDRSEDPTARDQRALVLAQRLITNGSAQAAEGVLLELRRDPDGPEYWPATVELCNFYALNDRYDEARKIALELDTADLTPEVYARAVVQAEMDMLLGRMEHFGDSLAEAHRRLASVPDRPGLSRLRAEVLVGSAYDRYLRALPFQHLIDEAFEHDRREPGDRMLFRPVMLQAVIQMASGRFEEARANLEEILRWTVDTGDDVSLPVIHSYRASLEVRACRFVEARQRAEEGLAVAAAAMPYYLPMLTNFLVSIDAHEGDHERALARSEEVRELLGALDDPSQEATWSVGRLAALRAAGRTEEAYAVAVRVRELGERLGWKHPADPMVHPPILDVLMDTGRLDEAEDYLADVRARARQIELQAVLAELVRFDVALMAARGDVDGAAAVVPAMLAGLDDLPAGVEVQPVERGRAWWTAGRVYLRGRNRRLAGDALETAVRIFEEIGCLGRAERARADLERAGRKRGDGTALTAAEIAVARAAAGGARNNEIAETLFMSTKTVEAHLSRCYRKLGIRSRVDLATALAHVTAAEDRAANGAGNRAGNGAGNRAGNAADRGADRGADQGAD